MHATDKPYAPARDRNRDPILAVLRQHFADRRQVLEIGSGTGQHAVRFAAALPHFTWQTSDRLENLAGIRLGLEEAALPNTPPPLALDVNGASPCQRFDAVFSANTLHILAWTKVERMFVQLPTVLSETAKLASYGPFNYGGRYISESNAQIDRWLKAEDARRGIRDFDAVHALAAGIGLTLLEDRAMPANNRCLIWQRVGGVGTHAG